MVYCITFQFRSTFDILYYFTKLLCSFVISIPVIQLKYCNIMW